MAQAMHWAERTLIFELELLSIKGAAGQARAQESEIAAASEVGIVERKAGIAPPAAASAAVPLGDIRVSFKLDPAAEWRNLRRRALDRLTYLHQRHAGRKEATVEAKAEGIAGSGRARLRQQWNGQPPRGCRDGHRRARVRAIRSRSPFTAPDKASSRCLQTEWPAQLLIKAKYVGNATQLEITRAVKKNE